MRNQSVVLAAVLLAGCAGGTNFQPVNVSAPAPSSAPQAMECVRRELDHLGYEVAPSSQSSTTSVTGIRVNEKPWWLRAIGFRNSADQITATISGGQLQVTATSSLPDDPAGGEQAATSGASETAAQNAQTIANTCGRGA